MKRFVTCPSWEPGSLVFDGNQFFIVAAHDRGSMWHAFGSKEGRVLISEKDEEMCTENVKCGEPVRQER